MASLSKLKIGLPFGIGEVEFELDQKQKEAAWELYVEFSTRIATQPLDLDSGTLSAAVASLRELFTECRGILRSGGPRLGLSAGTVGGSTIRVLNRGIRPFLSAIHATGAKGIALDDAKLRGELEALRLGLVEYCSQLGLMAGAA